MCQTVYFTNFIISLKFCHPVGKEIAPGRNPFLKLTLVIYTLVQIYLKDIIDSSSGMREETIIPKVNLLFSWGKGGQLRQSH